MKLTPLEKSHLASLAKRELSRVGTLEDVKALNRLVKLGLAAVMPRRRPEDWSITPAGEAHCRRAENMFTKAQITRLRKQIASGKYWVPKLGDLVYMRSLMSIDHGENDVCGGLAQVTKVYRGRSGGDENCVFIEIAQHDRGGNWTQFLWPDQKKLMARFGTGVAYPDPDYGY